MNAPVQPLFEADSKAALRAEASRLFQGQLETSLALRTTRPEERIAKLRQLRDTVEAHRADIQAALHADLRRPAMEADFADILTVLQEASFTMKHLKGWMKPQRVPTPMLLAGTSSHIRREPMGRCLIISPWNFPFNLALIPLIHAVAAGNTVIIKPSEFTPASNAVIRRIVESVFTENEVAVLEGEVEASQALLDLPFDHVFFTGSPAVGRVVMAAAAKHLGKVTLELGGKSPVVVDQSADVRAAARSVANGNHQNAGQICIAPDYLFVHDAVYTEFMAELKQAYADFLGADARAQRDSADYTRIISERHAERLQRLIQDAVEKGANIVFGGDTCVADRYVQPTALENVPVDARIMEEEVFGPVLPVIRYNDVETVIRHINSHPKPLALYVFANDRQLTDHVVSNTSSGNVSVNATLAHFAQHHLPFGGVNNSGLGSSHGYHGFKAFSHERGILVNHFGLLSLFFPPYTNWSRRLMNVVMRWMA